MTRSTLRWSMLIAVLALSAGCGGADDAAVDDAEPVQDEAAMQDEEAMDPGEEDGVGEVAFTISGDIAGEVVGTEVQCMEFRGTRSVTAVGEHDGESLDVAMSDETLEDGTFGKVIVGGYLRSGAQGGTLTIDESGATFQDLEVGAVTITGSITC